MSTLAASLDPHPGMAMPFCRDLKLLALSRLVLGLHYPSDVLAGAVLGAGLSILVLQF